jgi:hypothetical protein
MPGKFILASAALTAGLALTACGSGGGSAASAGPGKSPTASARPSVSPVASAASPGCLLQYRLWASGPAHAAGDNLTAALNGLAAASAASDVATASTALKSAGTAARALEHYPIPSCADPKGYWHAVLQQIEGAASSGANNAGTSQGQGALTIAQGVMKQMPELERKLASELQVTIPDLTRSK